MSDAQQAGDNTFVRPVRKSHLGVDYTCSSCGQPAGAEKWSMYFDPQMKLVMTVYCCERQAQFRVWLDMSGTI